MRDTPRNPVAHQTAALCGTGIADPILAAPNRGRINRPYIWAQAIRSDLPNTLPAGGRPHMDSRFRGNDDKKQSRGSDLRLLAGLGEADLGVLALDVGPGVPATSDCTAVIPSSAPHPLSQLH